MTDPVVTPVPGKPNLLLGAYDIADTGHIADAEGELGPTGGGA